MNLISARKFPLLIFLLLCCIIQSINAYEILSSRKVQTCRRIHNIASSLVHIRGGGDEEDFSDAYDEDEGVEEISDGSPLLSVSGVLGVLQKATIVTGKALIRSIKAAFVSDDEDDETEDTSLSTKILKTISRMWKAAIHPDDGGNETSTKKSKAKKKSQPPKKAANVDFGEHLSERYGVPDERDEETTSLFLSCSFQDALLQAHEKARLLVIFVPTKSTTEAENIVAIRSLLSQEVPLTANRPSRKAHETGSFLFWGAPPGSAEANHALKRAKAKQPPKGSRPNLLVVYPSLSINSSTGRSKINPQLLAQHHCSPPPAADAMAAWLNALRKRHSKEYKRMVKQLQEIKYFKERQEGYKSSIQDDKRRKEEEKRQARLEKEQAEKAKAHEEAIAKRRIELQDSLPEEPSSTGEGIVTIALRFADGRAGQRRFKADTPVSTIFDWADAEYEMEREIITLVTMNGQHRFENWEDTQTLEEAKGIGRMTGLRVIEKQEGDDNSDSKQEESR
mmetsp:Transcript_1533/g.2091  ORF Transcript_1533/g.2091 Transcript_1533/m.2091 type:complete len:508 (-) Transcript_1533:344-1867(-)|eukprot:CAMPEP_0178906536 /NCGR_PEP_ID=MMETSP0786-20121207/6882_1 /TAXON_ID=186022 /ORGANISM="Thalassionema frauenfeldii, Strain CCMP 1798" /LENGTH=507 /DNA_ID=CAMNT_0020578259 /DNA_START=93 /DNA_END=1619 /DNA_ORIENTATION=+